MEDTSVQQDTVESPTPQEQPQEPLMMSESKLKQRGWTKAAITKFLEKEDQLVPNPRYRHSSPMKLYSRKRVEYMERSDEFILWKRKHESKADSYKQVVHTKAKKLLDEVESWAVYVKELPISELKIKAMQSYNSFNNFKGTYRKDFDFTPASTMSNPRFLDRITVNYIRHKLIAYDNRLNQLFGKVACDQAYIAFNTKIYNKITEVYPMFKDECARQLEEKLKAHHLFEQMKKSKYLSKITEEESTEMLKDIEHTST